MFTLKILCPIYVRKTWRITKRLIMGKFEAKKILCMSLVSSWIYQNKFHSHPIQLTCHFLSNYTNPVCHAEAPLHPTSVSKYAQLSCSCLLNVTSIQLKWLIPFNFGGRASTSMSFSSLVTVRHGVSGSDRTAQG